MELHRANHELFQDNLSTDSIKGLATLAGSYLPI